MAFIVVRSILAVTLTVKYWISSPTLQNTDTLEGAAFHLVVIVIRITVIQLALTSTVDALQWYSVLTTFIKLFKKQIGNTDNKHPTTEERKTAIHCLKCDGLSRWVELWLKDISAQLQNLIKIRGYWIITASPHLKPTGLDADKVSSHWNQWVVFNAELSQPFHQCKHFFLCEEMISACLLLCAVLWVLLTPWSRFGEENMGAHMGRRG